MQFTKAHSSTIIGRLRTILDTLPSYYEDYRFAHGLESAKVLRVRLSDVIKQLEALPTERLDVEAEQNLEKLAYLTARTSDGVRKVRETFALRLEVAYEAKNQPAIDALLERLQNITEGGK